VRDLDVTHPRTPVSCDNPAYRPSGYRSTCRLPDNIRVSAENPSEISRMRISDADRDRAASVLSHALAEGRLTPQEHSERLDGIFAAKTQADITPLISDLPNAAALAHPGGTLVQPGYSGAIATTRRRARLVAILGGISRKGAWQVPASISAVTVLAGGDLDFRDAVLPSGEIRLRATCVLAGLDIIVPPEMRVIDGAWAIMGGIEVPPETEESRQPSAPVLRLSGVTIMGGVSVRRKPRDIDPPQAHGQLTSGS
jgi:hypothetical protein